MAAMWRTVFGCGSEEVFKQEARMALTGRCFRVKLYRPKRLGLVPAPFVRTVIQIDEPGFPFGFQPGHIHSVAVILAGQIGPPGGKGENRLVLRARPTGTPSTAAAGHADGWRCCRLCNALIRKASPNAKP
jgi:hypothetical protein